MLPSYKWSVGRGADGCVLQACYCSDEVYGDDLVLREHTFKFKMRMRQEVRRQCRRRAAATEAQATAAYNLLRPNKDTTGIGEKAYVLLTHLYRREHSEVLPGQISQGIDVELHDAAPI